MKVLHISKSNTYSGMENVAINIINSMPDSVESVYLTATGSVETKLLEANISYIGVEKVDEEAIKKAIDEVHPDIIHAYEYECSLMCTKVTDTIPIISHLYSVPKWVQKIGPKSVIYGSACKNFTKIIIPNQRVEDKAWFKDKMEGKTVVLGIRPEDIKDEEVFINTSPDSVVSVTIKVYEMLGAEVFLYFDIDGFDMCVRVNPRTTARPGDTIKLAFDLSKIHIFDKETEEAICN